MWQRNNGQAEDDLQFRFTAYLVSAVKRRRKDYLIQLYKRNSIESAVEAVYESEPSSEEVVLDRLPLMDVIENGVLLEALQKLNERERQIFLARTLEEEDFETLGAKFGLSYKGVAALYYRTIQKIRKSKHISQAVLSAMVCFSAPRLATRMPLRQSYRCTGHCYSSMPLLMAYLMKIYTRN